MNKNDKSHMLISIGVIGNSAIAWIAARLVTEAGIPLIFPLIFVSVITVTSTALLSQRLTMKKKEVK